MALTPDSLRRVLPNIIRVLSYYSFDAIAFRGLSGSLVAPIVAHMMDKTLLAVRKGEQCHSVHMVEGDHNARRYVILDDFISSGTTVREILKWVGREIPHARCIGALEYCYVNDNSESLTTDSYGIGQIARV